MKKYAKYIKSISILVLAMVPCVVLAANNFPGGSSNPLWSMFENLTFTPPETDLSVAFLAEMFGKVPGIEQFSTQGMTVIGVVFSIFNAGILAISGGFLGYTIFKVVTETTMDGSGMGKAGTMWTAVRVGLSTSLLIPQVSGYSLLNGIVMWVVIQGVGLADLTWSSALNYLDAGGLEYVAPEPAPDYSLINYDITAGSVVIDSTNTANSVGSADVLRSLVCSKCVKGALKLRHKLAKHEIKRELKQLKVLKKKAGRWVGWIFNYAIAEKKKEKRNLK